MVSNVQTIKSGGSVWGLVKAANPNASDAEINKKTGEVLKNNGLTWESAKSVKAGTKINLGTDAKDTTKKDTKTTDTKSSSTTTTSTATQAASNSSLDTSLSGLLKKWFEQQSTNGTASGGLDQYLKGKGVTSSSSSAASHGGNFAYNVSGQQFLPFADPNTILGNLGWTA